MGKVKKEMKPVILKIGLALAFSIGGMIYSFIRNNGIKPSQSSGRGLKSEHDASHKSPNSCKFDPLETRKHEELLNISPNRKSNEDTDFYLLPEFNDLLKEFDISTMKTTPDLPVSDSELPPKDDSVVINKRNEKEIKNLKNKVKMLKEREQNLEIQLLELYGLKELETTVTELQNRLKLNNMEAKLFALKIESLQTENSRLESQMSDYSKVLAELEDARDKIKVLKMKLRSESVQNKERILDLQQRVQKMQDDEETSGIELNVSKLKDLEVEAEELRKENYRLQVEKTELTRKLEDVQIRATSVLEDAEMEKLKQESVNLRNQNEDLSKEIEQLQAGRCSDIEELVYLRWINACLRYELRNHQPDTGKTMAQDLSKTLSPKSEQKAKQLILEYANKESDPKKSIHIPELDYDQWSSSQNSNVTDSGELDESFIDYSSSGKNNSKFFGKLVKFLRGGQGRKLSLERAESVNEDVHSCSDTSLTNLGILSKHRHSDVGIHKRIDSIAEGSGSLGSFSSLDGQKADIVKYAEVLEDSNPKPPIKFGRRRSTSLGSF